MRNREAIAAFGPESFGADLGRDPSDILVELHKPGRRSPDQKRLQEAVSERIQALFMAGLTMHEIADVWRLPVENVEARIGLDLTIDRTGAEYRWVTLSDASAEVPEEPQPEWRWPWPKEMDSPEQAIQHCGLAGVAHSLDIEEDQLADLIEAQERTPELLRLREIRDAALVQLRWAGLGLDEIGQEWGLTRERVRQIVMKRGGPTREQVTEVRRRQAEAQRLREEDSVLELIGGGHVLSVQEVAVLLDWPEERVRAALTPRTRSLLATPKKSSTPGSTWSEDEVTGILQGIAAIVDDSPKRKSAVTGEEYDLYKVDFGGPSRATIAKIFGSWNEALAAAGLSTWKGRPKSSKYTDDRLWGYLDKYVCDPAVTSVTFHGFDEWRVVHAPAAPSAQFIRNRLGPWSYLRAEALRRATAASSRISTDASGEIRDLDDFETWAADETLNRVRAGGANPAEPADYDRYLVEGAPGSHRLEALFGSWGMALGALGWDPTEFVATRGLVSDSEATSHLREYAATFLEISGRAPTAHDWDADRDKKTTVGSWSYLRRFDTWRDALAAADVPENQLPPKFAFYSDDDLDAALRDGLRDLGPLTIEAWDALRPEGAPSGGTYLRRFGTWAESIRRAMRDG